MSKIMKNNSLNKALSKSLLAILTLMILGLANLAVSAQQQNCPLVVSSTAGDLDAFTISGEGTTQLSIVSIGSPLQSVVPSSVVNANVSVSSFQNFGPVNITASKVNSNQPASFTLTVSNLYHTIVINAIVNCPSVPQGCTRTQGFYKNKPEEWAVTSLTLGNVSYTQTQLLAILRTPVRGNGLISLAHQLIAAKLNAAAGTTVPASVATAIAAADALIGGLVVPPVGNGSLPTSSTSSLTSTLDAYNNGLTPGGPPHCDD